MILLGLVLPLGLAGQHFEYTQFTYTPLQVNPAVLPNQADFWISAAFRSQATGLGSRAAMPSVTALYALKDAKSRKVRAFIGGSIISEQSGPGNAIQNTGLLLNYSYLIHFKKEFFLSLGLQAGAFNRSVNLSDLRTEAQFTGVGFDMGRANGEDLAQDSKLFPVFSGGATWCYQDSYSRKRVWLGVAAFQLNEPDWGLMDIEDRLPARIVANAGIIVPVQTDFTVSPMVRWVHQAGSNIGHTGFKFRYHYGAFSQADGHFGVGGWYSFANTVGLSMEYRRNALSVAANIDMGASSRIDNMQAHNGFELILAMAIGRDE